MYNICYFFPHKSPAPRVLSLHQGRSSFFWKTRTVKSLQMERWRYKSSFAKIVLFNTSFLGSVGSNLWRFAIFLFFSKLLTRQKQDDMVTKKIKSLGGLILPTFINCLTSARQELKSENKRQDKGHLFNAGWGTECALLSQISLQKFYECLVRLLGNSHVPRRPPVSGTSPDPAPRDVTPGRQLWGVPIPAPLVEKKISFPFPDEQVFLRGKGGGCNLSLSSP